MGMLGQIGPQEQPAQQPMQPQQPDEKSIMDAVHRVVMAAQKVMYSEKTHEFFAKQLESFQDPAQKAGMGAVALIGILMQEAKGKLDPRTIVPAGIILVADIMDFVGQTSGQEFTEEDNKKAMMIFLQEITKLMGGAQQSQPEQQEAAVPQQGAMQ